MGLWREYTEPFNSKTQRRRSETGQKLKRKKQLVRKEDQRGRYITLPHGILSVSSEGTLDGTAMAGWVDGSVFFPRRPFVYVVSFRSIRRTGDGLARLNQMNIPLT